MAKSHFPAHGRWQADSFIALAQLNEHLVEDPDLIRALRKPKFETRQKRVKEEHAGRLASFANLAAPIDKEERLTAHNVGRAIKHMVPSNTVFVIEAVTNAMLIADQLWISLPGSWSNCGLGWSGGAALGVKLALDASGKARFVCAVVCDGRFLYSFPGSVFLVASRNHSGIDCRTKQQGSVLTPSDMRLFRWKSRIT